DGPSAGVAMVTAIYSAITGQPVSGTVAMTGEVSIRGLVRPVGGIAAKVEAAGHAGVKKVIIPAGNWQEAFAKDPLKGATVVCPVTRIEEVVEHAVLPAKEPLSVSPEAARPSSPSVPPAAEKEPSPSVALM